MPRGIYVRTPENSFLGKHLSPEHKLKKRLAVLGDKSILWKGDVAGYAAKHYVIQSHLGKAHKCMANLEHINRKRYEWASLDHKYSRNLEDYIQLCNSCHRKYDTGKIAVLGKTITKRGGGILIYPKRPGCSWNTGLTKETSPKLAQIGRNISAAKSTPEAKERYKQIALKQWEKKRGV